MVKQTIENKRTLYGIIFGVIFFMIVFIISINGFDIADKFDLDMVHAGTLTAFIIPGLFATTLISIGIIINRKDMILGGIFIIVFYIIFAIIYFPILNFIDNLI